MIPVGKWRWPLILSLPLVVGSLLVWRGIGRLVYEGSTLLTFSGDSKRIDPELKIFRSNNVRQRIDLVVGHPAGILTYEKLPGRLLEISIKSQAVWPKDVVQALAAADKVCVEQSLAGQKAELRKEMDVLQKERLAWQARLDPLMIERKTLAGSHAGSSRRAGSAVRIQELLARRQFLIEHYPTHTDIALLAKQIKDLRYQSHPRTTAASTQQVDLDRRINETKMRLDYFSRQLQDLVRTEQVLKPDWKAALTIQKPVYPVRVDQWPIFSGAVVGALLLGFVLWMRGPSARKSAPPHKIPDLGPKAPDAVELKLVPAEPELPADPLTEKAAMIYAKWVEVTEVLYAPAPEPPQGILDSVGPLLQESSDFLPEGHDVMARYLARTVAPGDLPAHVARTVLMTLTGAEEAGASPEHRLAMALAALFHDLAMVPRLPAGRQARSDEWADVGSEVGRLSAGVLRRIPGLQPAILSMVEDILIGMDEFKLETWQNAAAGKNLEPLSKVLREIDRFEKVMQKQRARLDRRVANQ